MLGRADPFDPINDITALVLAVNPKVAAKDLKELVALLKVQPGGLNYASSGNGTIVHLAAEMFLDEAGVGVALKGNHIPYKGVGPMVTDLLGGQVDSGASEERCFACHWHLIKSAPEYRTGHRSVRRTGIAESHRRRLVRSDRAQEFTSD